jgi:hypothetical protein
MKKYTTLILTAAVCLSAINIQAQITRQQAEDLVLNQILADDIGSVDVYVLGTAKTNQGPLILGNGDTLELPYSSNWVFFVDDLPFANWAHPCRYIFVNEANGDYSIIAEAFFPHNCSDYVNISLIPRPTPINLPLNPNAVINGLEPNPNLYAVIICQGPYPDFIFFPPRYLNNLSAMYCTLLEVYGFTRENIFVHYSNGTDTIYNGDLNNDSIMDIDYPATKFAIMRTFNELSGNTTDSVNIPKLGPDDLLFIYVISHGDMVNDTSEFSVIGNPNKIYDYELAEWMEDIESAQIIALFHQCFAGGFVNKLSDTINYDVKCKNRTIHSASNEEPSKSELWITAGQYDEFLFYWTAAARGYYPHNSIPWELTYAVGEFPFENYPKMIDHPGDFHPDLNEDGFVQMEEAFYYASYLDTWVNNDTGYYFPFCDTLWSSQGWYTIICDSTAIYHPQVYSDIVLNDTLLTLSGLAGHIETSQTIDDRSFLVGGKLSIMPDVSLTLEGDSRFFLGNEIAGIKVEEDAELKIKSELAFSEEANLIVKRGSKLIIDGGTLTSHDPNSLWPGIQVWGDNTKSQYPDNGIMHQGQVIVTNGSLIENAKTGIYAGIEDAGFGNPSYNGGIVMASSSEFRNNETSIHLPPYENFHPVNEEPRNNLSYVENCDFILTDSDLTEFDPQIFIKLDGVSGISLAGNHFTNQVNGEVIPEITGIQSLNSGFTVDKFCIDEIPPCENYRLSTFENLLYGIKALGAATAKTFTVDTSIFISNRIGVYVNGVDNFSVIKSDFLVENPDNAEPEILCGIYLENEAVGFSIEENTFTGPDNSPEQNTSIGITLNNTGHSNNELYNNTFTGLYIGTLAQNVNRDRAGTGLCIKCNHYSSNDYDIAVTYDEQLYELAGIASPQGSAAPSPDAPAGNRFSWAGDENTPTDINNEAEHITYYYHANALPTLQLEPKYYTGVTIVPNYDADWTPEESCPSNLNPPGGGRDEETLRGMMAGAGQESESTQLLINALIDAGDTDALYWDVNMSAPWQSLEVYNELMSVAPYVSDTVLEAAIVKENVLVDAMIRDVLVANPHSAKRQALIDKLDQRIEPLPEYMLDEILQGQSLVSVYEKLQSGLAYHRRKQALYQKQLVQLYLNDNDNLQAKSDSLVNLLLGSNIPAHWYQAAFKRYEQGEKTASANILSSLPSVFSFTAEQLSKHTDILALLEQDNTLRLQDKSLLVPDSLASAWLMDMMDYGNEPSNIYARNILLAHNIVEHYPQYLLPDGTKSKKDKRQRRQDETANEMLKLFPNPAREYVIIDFDFSGLKPANGNGILRVSSMEGKEIETLALNKTRDQIVFSLKDYKPGAYLFMLYYNGRMVGSKRLIIN